MITDHSYLDGPTFRGMRQSLLRTFDDIYVLDLHGNARKRGTGPDGSPDQSVFDIMEGVAIAFFVKRGDSTPDGGATTPWCITPGVSGAVKQIRLAARARPGQHRVADAESSVAALPVRAARRGARGRLQPVHAGDRGLPRAQRRHRDGTRQPDDSLSADDVWNTVTVFSRMEPELARQGYELGKDAQDWKVELAQQDVRDSGPARDGPCQSCTGHLTCATRITPAALGASSAGRAPRSCATFWPGKPGAARLPTNGQRNMAALPGYEWSYG